MRTTGPRARGHRGSTYPLGGAQALRPAKQSVDAVVETFQQDDISEAITSGNSAVRTIPGLDPAIHPPAKEMDPRVEPGVTDVMHS